MIKKNTTQVMVGDLAVGGGAPIVIQSMTNTHTFNKKETVAQILELVGLETICANIESKKTPLNDSIATYENDMISLHLSNLRRIFQIVGESIQFQVPGAVQK